MYVFIYTYIYLYSHKYIGLHIIHFFTNFYVICNMSWFIGHFACSTMKRNVLLFL